MSDPGDIRARLQLRAGADAASPSSIWAGELRALLAGVRDLASLSAAAGRLGMEYRHAWRVLRRAEKLFGAQLATRRAGGAHGGGSTLTAEGTELLTRLETVLEDVARTTAGTFGHSLQGGVLPAGGNVIILASSTEPAETGLLERLESAFLEDTGLIVRHIAAGSGQAHSLAEHGRADAVLSHAPELEQSFMERGIGVSRRAVMRNHYIVLGPYQDPADLAGLAGAASVSAMFARIAERRAPFVSRNDASGTNLKERELWSDIGVEPDAAWYHTPPEAGGSAAAVRCAMRLGAYTLVDSATAYRHIELRRFLPRESPGEENIFSLLVVDNRRVPGANTDGALRLAEWLGSEHARAIIASFGTPSPLFHPIA